MRRAHYRPAFFYVLDLLDTIESLRAQVEGRSTPRGFAMILDEAACQKIHPFPNSRREGHVVVDLLETIAHLRTLLSEQGIRSARAG